MNTLFPEPYSRAMFQSRVQNREYTKSVDETVQGQIVAVVERLQMLPA
ncbi:hypothetical protein IQ268_04115 [Oculatella sp. LEGE 06141]|nr:hypothetical protein [Oculatella sp. LEGE 06141]MBE9177765.1 hypothetical protein [Oculatella sp. LEGE 06141]